MRFSFLLSIFVGVFVAGCSDTGVDPQTSCPENLVYDQESGECLEPYFDDGGEEQATAGGVPAQPSLGWMDDDVRQGVTAIAQSDTVQSAIRKILTAAPQAPSQFGLRLGMTSEQAYAALRPNFEPNPPPHRSWAERAYISTLTKLRRDVPTLAKDGKVHFDNANAWLDDRRRMYFGFPEGRAMPGSMDDAAPGSTGSYAEGRNARAGERIHLDFVQTAIGEFLTGFQHEVVDLVSAERALALAESALGRPISPKELAEFKEDNSVGMSNGTGFGISISREASGHDPATGQTTYLYRYRALYWGDKYATAMRSASAVGLDEVYAILLQKVQRETMSQGT